MRTDYNKFNDSTNLAARMRRLDSLDNQRNNQTNYQSNNNSGNSTYREKLYAKADRALSDPNYASGLYRNRNRTSPFGDPSLNSWGRDRLRLAENMKNGMRQGASSASDSQPSRSGRYRTYRDKLNAKADRALSDPNYASDLYRNRNRTSPFGDPSLNSWGRDRLRLAENMRNGMRQGASSTRPARYGSYKDKLYARADRALSDPNYASDLYRNRMRTSPFGDPSLSSWARDRIRLAN